MFGIELSLPNILAFAAAALLVYAIAEFVLSFREPKYKHIQRRLKDDLGMAAGGEQKSRNVVKALDQDSKWAMARWLAASSRGMTFRKLCYQAALRIPPHQFLVGVASAVVVVLLAAIFLNLNLYTILSLLLIVSLGPFVVLLIMRNQRMKKFTQQLPDVLELLSQCLRAGHSLQAGFQLVAEQLPDPVGTEFERVYVEQGLGIPLEEALDHLAERVDLLDLRMFITAVHIQRQTGGDLTELMDKLGSVIRDRMTILGQVKALTAEGRLSGVILTALPLVVLLVLFQLNPKHPQVLFGTETGRIMLVFALFMQIIGTIAIRRIVNIRV